MPYKDPSAHTTRASRGHRPDGINPYRELCGAKKTDGSGDMCGNTAGHGTDHEGIGLCKWHGGMTDAGKKSAANLMAARVIGQYQAYGAGEMDIEPHEAILWCVRMTADEIRYISAKCAECATYMVDEQEDPNHFASRRLQALVREKGLAMDRLAKYSKMAMDAGVEERRVRIAETGGEQLAELLRFVLEDLELTPAQRRVAPAIAQRRLLELEQGLFTNGSAEEILA